MSALSAAAHATRTLDDAASANAVAEPLAARPVIRDVKIGKLPAASRDKDPSSSRLLGKRKTENGRREAGAGRGRRMTANGKRGRGRGMTAKSKLGGRNGAVW